MHAHTDVLRQLFTRPAVKPSLSGSRMIRYYMYMYVHVCVCGGWGGGGACVHECVRQLFPLVLLWSLA